MDKHYIDKNAVIDRYVMGKLSGEELEQFEIYMLDNPAIIADIEYATALQSTLQSKSELGSSTDESVKGKRSRYASQQRLFATAATVLLVVTSALSVTLYQKNRSMSEQLARAQGLQAISSQLVLVSTRSDSMAPEAWVDADLSPILISLEVPPDLGGETVTVSISGVDSNFFWQSEGAIVNSRYEVQLMMGGLPKGIYKISATSVNGQGSVVSSTFGVR